MESLALGQCFKFSIVSTQVQVHKTCKSSGDSVRFRKIYLRFYFLFKDLFNSYNINTRYLAIQDVTKMVSKHS